MLRGDFVNMSLKQTKLFKAVVCPVLFFASFFVLHDSYRVTAEILLFVLIVSYIHFLRTTKTKWMRLIFVAFLVAAFLPVDLTFQNFPGPPRFVPLIMGLTDGARASRGEVMVGGCMVRGNEPRWVWVW